MKLDPRIYPHSKFNQLLDQTIIELKKLAELKGGEYAGDEDRLANFRRNAIALDAPSMELVWAIYAAKHWDAIIQYIKDLSSGKERTRLESLSGRADDLIVYLILFKAMLDEREYSPDMPAAELNSKDGDPRMTMSLKDMSLHEANAIKRAEISSQAARETNTNNTDAEYPR